MRVALATVLVLLAAATVSGCGASEPAQVRTKVEQFVAAVAAHDARTVCREVLAPSLVDRFSSEGLSCERGIGIFFNSVQDPTLSIGTVTVDGNTASATVLAGARCQRLAIARLYLVKTSEGWRISSESAQPGGRPTC